MVLLRTTVTMGGVARCPYPLVAPMQRQGLRQSTQLTRPRTTLNETRTSIKFTLCRSTQDPVSELSDEELEKQLEKFMQEQAAKEGGLAQAPSAATSTGAPVQEKVPKKTAAQFCQDIVDVLRRLKKERDMSLTEVRLTVAVEDPRARERRLMGMEDSSGVSREELAAALVEISEGKVPGDFRVLQELHREMTTWPGLDEDATPGKVTTEDLRPQLTPAAEEAAAAWRTSPSPRPPVGRGTSQEAAGPLDLLPDWVGYSALYLVSIAPVLIAVAAIAILFYSSLR
ncbi:Y3IP1 [Auxenochlorella protothecoides x Auxenochlorella symbiontica]